MSGSLNRYYADVFTDIQWRVFGAACSKTYEAQGVFKIGQTTIKTICEYTHDAILMTGCEDDLHIQLYKIQTTAQKYNMEKLFKQCLFQKTP